MHVLLCASLFLGQAGDDVFDLKAILAPPPGVRILKTTEKDGLVTEEVMFFSETDGEKKVEIFAFFCYPRGAKNLPAFIWNQGGLYQASPHFPLLGARRGYAALCIDFPIPGYRSTGGYPINSGLELTPDPRKAPIYHGAVALLRSVSFLQSRSEVDKDRIGMAGSSWGGFYTSLMVGIDPRLKVGSSMFGSGSLQLGNAWWDGAGKDPKRDVAFRKRWSQTLDPTFRLAKVKTPMAWFTGTDDLFYWLPAVLDSQRQAGGPTHLGLLPNFDHALTPELDEQVFAWLDIHLKGAEPFLKIADFKAETGKPRSLAWKFDGKRKVKNAELCVSFGPPGNWRGRYWMTIPAKIEGSTCRVEVPASRLPALAFANVIDADGFRTSTPLLTMDGDPGAAQAVPSYDGASMWSPFSSKERLAYLQLHGLPLPKLNEDAAVLLTGKHSFGPLYFTTGVPHRLAFEFAGQGASAKLSLAGTFDGKAIREETTLSPAKGEAWTKGQLTITPPPGDACSLRIEVIVPEKSGVRIRDFRFTPETR